MNKEKELTLTEDQIKIERGNFHLNSSSPITTLRTSYLNDNDGTDTSDTDSTDGEDTDGTDSADADGEDKRM